MEYECPLSITCTDEDRDSAAEFATPYVSGTSP